MRNILGVTMAAGAVVAGSVVVNDYFQPPAAAWLNEGKSVPEIRQTALPSEEVGIVAKHTNQGNVEQSKYITEVHADLIGTGPPLMDDYPKSPEEAAERSQQNEKSSKSLTKAMQDIVNFGYHKDH
jgi:hypothetical protein